MDSGDKATNKAMAIAFKYACFQIFCIPTEEMKDPDSDSHQIKPKGSGEEPNQNKEQSNQQMIQDAANTVIDEIKMKVIREIIQNKGYSEASVLKHYQLNDFSTMTISQWSNAMNLLENAPYKK